MRGRRTGISRSGGRNDGYSYDAAGQVIAGGYDATAAGSQTDGFAYDAAGNRTQSARNGAGTAYTPNVADQYASVGGTAQAYDPAGNQTTLQLPGGPLIALTYDAENRLTSEEKSTGIPRADKARVVSSYDSLQRRVRKQIYARNSGDTAWTLTKTILFTYEGWNVIEEREFLTSALTPSSTYYRYTWGADVSGSRQGAGGVGGLIMSEEVPASGTATAHFYAYDGNGNVTHVLDATGTVEAQYRYSAFGGDLGSTTSTAFAQRNPWRFSTKYLDREVETSEGFYYYGYRHYFTALGRWGSRDPLGERGGVNLYGMVGNMPLNVVDILGTMMSPSECEKLKNEIEKMKQCITDHNYDPKAWAAVAAATSSPDKILQLQQQLAQKDLDTAINNVSNNGVAVFSAIVGLASGGAADLVAGGAVGFSTLYVAAASGAISGLLWNHGAMAEAGSAAHALNAATANLNAHNYTNNVAQFMKAAADSFKKALDSMQERYDKECKEVCKVN